MPTTFPALLRAAAAENPDRVFLHCASERAAEEAVTFAELERRARRVAAGLLARGLRPGDRIAVAAPNSAEWLELFFGAVSIGVVVVTLNVRYRESELEYMLNQAGARLLVTAAAAGDVDLEAFYRAFRPRIPTVEHVLFTGGTGAGERYRDLPVDPPDPADLDRRAEAVRASDPAVILYTSGTTGTPKGAVLTHASMIGSGTAQARRIGTGPDDVYFSAMPLNHVGGLTCGVTSALVGRSTLVLAPAFSPAGALDAMERHRVTMFGGVPTMLTLVLGHESFPDRDTRSVRLAMVGGANADPTLCAAIAKGFPNARLFNLYGLSEVSGACVMSAPDDDLTTVSRTLGTPLDGVRARVVDPDGHDVTEGELLVQGPGTAAGYWELPDASAEVFLPDGWVATGDIVSADPDGHLSIRGRRKEMFIQGGYNVYPVEVENVLTAHPAVAMAAGIGVPDPVLGEIGRYYLQLRPGQSVGPDELIAFCAARLADYKVPRQIELVDELPTTPSGKVAKAALRDRLATG
ncbi:class I adenylate-forming enzyme family protein [Pseudonocardia acaciae]|uniref:class I adenylate-forming enzyme family protein n=1 Tax=Pseudonocardia acaciae TaxID=551276 RepID=UPI00055F10B7|nr:AMP-binding protein [Pseudonocardia acaciae]